ncbi:MAG: CDP-alcohol phosphatidyltransferase family protein [Gammaproteobacteria bacterium]|nr:CDP-alcohol phosphatidyltransferase family protein [Gammaproteobacteria bacterium]
MPSIYQLKPAFQSLLRPLTGWLAGRGISANQVTVAAALLSLVVGGLVALYPHHHWPLLLVPAVLFIRMALNAIDGMLAREHDMQSPLGGMLNELGDVVSDAALYLPLSLINGISPLPVVLLVLAATIVEMTGVVAVQIGASRRYDGPFGKSDRAFLVGAVALLLGIGIRPEPWVDWLMLAMLLLSVITIFNRARQALRELA